jgi:hypothetical protein
MVANGLIVCGLYTSEDTAVLLLVLIHQRTTISGEPQMTLLLKRLAAASLAGGALAVSPIMLPAASAVDGQPPAECADYESPATSSTTVSIEPSEPEAGDTFTATAEVLVAGAPAQSGTVTFTFNGNAKDVDVVDGIAQAEFTVPTSGGNFEVLASFDGICVTGAGATAANGSSDSAGFVAGVEDTSGGDDSNGGSTGGTSTGGTTGTTTGSNRAGTSAGVNGVTGDTGSSTGSLGGTGVDTQTELYALIGLGLVAVGGMSLMVHRRRVQA